jgi:hypothetical protein
MFSIFHHTLNATSGVEVMHPPTVQSLTDEVNILESDIHCLESRFSFLMRRLVAEKIQPLIDAAQRSDIETEET